MDETDINTTKEDKPVIIDKDDYSEHDYAVLCGMFCLNPKNVDSFVLREGFSLEYKGEE